MCKSKDLTPLMYSENMFHSYKNPKVILTSIGVGASILFVNTYFNKDSSVDNNMTFIAAAAGSSIMLNPKNNIAQQATANSDAAPEKALVSKNNSIKQQ